MPDKCCVPLCNGNYKGGPKVSVFGFPQEQELKKKWINSIKRKDFVPNTRSKVCELHFNDHDIIKTQSAFNEKTGERITCKLRYPRLQPGAIPSQLPNCPSYLSKTSEVPRTSRSDMLQKKEEEQLTKALQQSKEDEQKREEHDSCGTLSDVRKKLKLESPWQFVEQNSQELTICKINNSDHFGPQINSAIVITQDLSLNVFVNSVKLPQLEDQKLPLKVTRLSAINQICKTITKIKSSDAIENTNSTDLDAVFSFHLKLIISLLCLFKTEKCSFNSYVSFICEQLELLMKEKRSYSNDFLIFSSIFYNLSPHAYRFLRSSGRLILPCYTTIRKLTLSSSMDPFIEQSDATFLFYIKQKHKALSSGDKTVSLLVDEIHLKPYFDFKGGNITGAASNSEEAAKSAFVFMISSFFSCYKDVVYILPSKKMKAETLHNVISKTITGLETIGFRVITVITDNNSINGKAMSFFSSPPKKSIVYPHPYENSRPLFFLLDTVHILKCIRNNWLNQKSANQCIVYPSFNFSNINTENSSGVSCASFEALKYLHQIECHQNLKFAYKLSVKALNPSNLERQKVTLVLQIFNEFVSQALLQLGEKFDIPQYHDTSTFIQLITTWWDVVNVKTPQKGRRLNNKFQQPFTSNDSNEPRLFLQYFSDWLSKWNRSEQTFGNLTKETFGALVHSTHGLFEIAEYCMQELGAKYVLLGKFQTDSLESRFGQYRQLSGGKYDVSLRQVYECEKKIRLLSVLKLKMNGVDINLSDFSLDWDRYEANFSSHCPSLPVVITDTDVNSANDSIPVIMYVAGYCCYSINKKLQCDECKTKITSNNGDISNNFNNGLIKGISRGGLLYPSCDMAHVVLISYIVFDKVCKHEEFLKSHCHRSLVINTILSALDDELLLFDFDCSAGHEPTKLTNMAVFICANVLLNNYCFVRNDGLGAAKLAKRRKLQTLC